jgi:ABC-type Fe3+-hydroxamate transport system substrate-binding protein
MDKVVGVGEHFFQQDYTKALFPEFKDLPNVGTWDNYEAILSQIPDSVVVYS